MDYLTNEELSKFKELAEELVFIQVGEDIYMKESSCFGGVRHYSIINPISLVRYLATVVTIDGMERKELLRKEKAKRFRANMKWINSL